MPLGVPGCGWESGPREYSCAHDNVIALQQSSANRTDRILTVIISKQPVRTYLCLFDLPAYDIRVAPALRLYRNKYDPKEVVALMRDIATLLPALLKDGRARVPDADDCQHWIDSLGPDAGYKPSEQTMREVAAMLIECLCVPHGLGFSPIEDLDKLMPALARKSEWFADLMDGGEELAGGRLEFSFGSGSLIATRQQVRQFLDEVPEEPEYRNLLRLLRAADQEQDYTLLKTAL